MARAKAQGRDAATVRPPPVVGVANALKASLGFRYRARGRRRFRVVAAAFDRLGAAAGPILGAPRGARGDGRARGGARVQGAADAVRRERGGGARAATGARHAAAAARGGHRRGDPREGVGDRRRGDGWFTRRPGGGRLDVAMGGLGAELDASTGATSRARRGRGCGSFPCSASPSAARAELLRRGAPSDGEAASGSARRARNRGQGVRGAEVRRGGGGAVEPPPRVLSVARGRRGRVPRLAGALARIGARRARRLCADPSRRRCEGSCGRR